MSERDVTAADGRVLRVSEGGDPGGTPVLHLPGSPGSRVLPAFELERAARRGVRLISYDRPGYGGSTRHPGRNVADCASDVRAIAGALGVRRMAVWGTSGGAPHAAACAALLSGLVGAVGLLGCPAPYGAPGLNWTADMGANVVAEFAAVREGPAAARRWLQSARAEMLGESASEDAEVNEWPFTEPDVAALERIGGPLFEALRVGLAPGVDGWLDDDLATVADWGFGLSQIRVPVLVMHGGRDGLVPVAHGRWLAEAIPGAELRVYEDEGHVSPLANRLDELYDWLLERAL